MIIIYLQAKLICVIYKIMQVMFFKYQISEAFHIRGNIKGNIIQNLELYIQLAIDISTSTVSSLSNARFSSFVLFCFLPPLLRLPLLSTPFSSSIIRKICVWSELSIGAIEISRTARNLPQLFKCSFSKRKKFHTNRLKKQFYNETKKYRKIFK